MNTPRYETTAGRPHPLGAVPDINGVNFSVFSRNATSVELLLFDGHDDREPAQIVKLDPAVNKTFFFWHVYVRGLRAGAHYAYRVDGPTDLHGQGFRYNPNKVLIDPYACGNTDTLWNRADACGPNDNLATSHAQCGHRHVRLRLGRGSASQPADERADYLRDARRRLHAASFVGSQTSRALCPRSSRRFLTCKELGITAVELLPVMEFDYKEVLRMKPDGSGPLTNYWGYSTVSFFAPESSYCVSPEQGAHVREFRDMVKALHRAGIAVILDTVFNHTSEGKPPRPDDQLQGLL